MFIGHFAVGLAGKRAAPRTDLGLLILAPVFLDFVWPIFLVTGIESVRIDPGNTAFTPLDLHDYPWSHSLGMAIVWSVLFGLVYHAATRYRRGAVVLGLGVFSHWVLDFVTHRPDMPLYPGSATFVGLGLWNSVAGTMVVEIAMFAAGAAIYATATRAKDRVGTFAFWALVGVLGVLYVASAFGPPPPSVAAIEIAGFVGYLFVPWGWWIDRHRAPRIT
ncbi:MAG TPA: hypothetical protein VKE22_07600 [Haliangiales bacterium]|nr:hypothetical protein [Haliangiales bacterium]